jgi:hypothetical protein
MKKREKLKRPINLGLAYETFVDTGAIATKHAQNLGGINVSGRMNCTCTDWVYDALLKCDTKYYTCTNPDTHFSVNVSVTNCGTGQWHSSSL